MAKAGMNPKTLQYLMGHSDIGVTMNTYTHLGLEDAQDEMIRMEELNAARAEVNKSTGEKPVTQKQFRVVQRDKNDSTQAAMLGCFFQWRKVDGCGKMKGNNLKERG